MTETIQSSFPTVFLDRAVHAMSLVGDMVIQFEAQCPFRLDEARLARSLTLLGVAEPVLACRLEDDGQMGVWRPCGLGPEALSLVESRDDYDRVRSATLDVTKGPLVEACVWRSDAGDRLLLRVAHQVADAGAVKQIVLRLASIYEKLKREPRYRTEPNRVDERDIDQVTRHIPWTARPGILGRMLGEGIGQSLGRKCATPEISVAPVPDRPAFITRIFDSDFTARLAAVGHGTHATINDVILTAFLRGLAQIGRQIESRALVMNMTIDLRRHLPNGQSHGLCNLSGIESVSLGKPVAEGFLDTLQKVTRQTRSRKAHYMGMNVYGSPMLSLLRSVPQERYTRLFTQKFRSLIQGEKLPPALTNMGLIQDVNFDGPPSWCRLLVPPMRPPAIVLGLSGWQGTLCLSAVAYPPSRAAVEALLNASIAQLETAP